MKKHKKFWEWKNQVEPESDQERVLELYGQIAETSWFDDDVTPKMFRDELFAGSGPVTIFLNSPGGDCIAASQIYTMLIDYKGDVTIKIDGIAASAASVIAMAGTKVLMAPTALMMIHNPMTMAYGNHAEMEKAIEMLDEVKESIINAYEIKTGMSRAKLSHLMDAETWMNAAKAIELGFADDILKDEKREASEIPAYAFSGKETETRLMNKITAHYKPVTKAMTPAQAAAIPAAKDVTPATAGKTYDELMTRLNLIRP
ncbi:head maturation protease, ClpP-related [Mogibacterium kristiansenii]|uniref:head maturation protease, ClpP-related n=1 Tax=Mogibacterium kristiansenii TaxID=2606708 RepID=UPI00240A40E6|nr:head maturation protease, ClpP-related [Mogibacterium kristiansenii]MDD6699448.1 Clp protease ClpP [Mogibacterium kristiansenii]